MSLPPWGELASSLLVPGRDLGDTPRGGGFQKDAVQSKGRCGPRGHVRTVWAEEGP